MRIKVALGDRENVFAILFDAGGTDGAPVANGALASEVRGVAKKVPSPNQQATRGLAIQVAEASEHDTTHLASLGLIGDRTRAETYADRYPQGVMTR